MAVVTPLKDGFRGLGTLGNQFGANPFDEPTASSLFEKALSTLVGVMTVIAGIWFLFLVISAALEWLHSGGEKQALQNAQKKLTNGVIGLFLVVVSYGLILAIGNITGLNNLLNPAAVIPTLTP